MPLLFNAHLDDPAVNIANIALPCVTDDDGRNPWFFWRDSYRKYGSAVLMPDGRLMVCEVDGSMRVYDVGTRSCVWQGKLEHYRGQPDFSPDGRLLYARDGDTATDVFEFPTLRPIARFGDRLLDRGDGSSYDIVEMGQFAREEWSELTKAGRVLPLGRIPASNGVGGIHASGYYQYGMDETLAGLQILDMDRKRATLHIIERVRRGVPVTVAPLGSVSPDGRFAVRKHRGAIPYHKGRRWIDRSIPRIGRSSEAGFPDCEADGKERIGLALELWQIDPLRPLRKIIVRMFTAEEIEWFMGRHRFERLLEIAKAADFHSSPFQIVFGIGGNAPQHVLSRIDANCRRIWDELHFGGLAWEPDSSAFWISLPGPAVRRVSVDGVVSPQFVVDRWVDSDEGLDGLRLSRLPDGRLQMSLSIGDKAGQVTFRPDLSIARGNIVMVGPDEDGYVAPAKRPPGIDAEILQIVETAIPLSDLSEASCIAAIDSLTRTIDERLEERVWAGYFRSAFLLPNARLDEPTFFAHVRNHCPGAVPALRRLIQTLVAHPKRTRLISSSGNLYYDEETHALGHAVLALAQMDAQSHDVLTSFLEIRDAGHEPFADHVIMPAYRQTHGWRDKGAVRLGLTHYLMHPPGGGRWGDADLLDSAAQLMSPGEFATMVDAATRRYCVLARYRNPEKEIAARLERQAKQLGVMSDFGRAASDILRQQTFAARPESAPLPVR